jgi:hypothetical protein
MSPLSGTLSGEGEPSRLPVTDEIVLDDLPLEQRRNRRRIGLQDDVFVGHWAACPCW